MTLSIIVFYCLIINGIRVTVFNWFKNYLTNRKQYVAIDNVSSTISNIDCGIHQGSVLGSLLFLIYMDDIVVEIVGLFFTCLLMTQMFC